jgi:hypothetical protein
MQRWLIPLAMALLSLAFVAGAFAASAPPSALCLQCTDATDVKVFLVIKNQGTMKTTAAGSVKFYQLTGELFNISTNLSIPVTGTAHMNGDTLHFSFRGSAKWPTSANIYTENNTGTYNVITQTGSISYNTIFNNTPGATFSHPLQTISCGSASLPLNAYGE